MIVLLHAKVVLFKGFCGVLRGNPWPIQDLFRLPANDRCQPIWMPCPFHRHQATERDKKPGALLCI